MSDHTRELENELIRRELADLKRGQHVILRVLAALSKQGDAVLMISQELKDAMAELDTETTAIGNRIADLSGQITTAMTPDEVKQVVDQLNSESSRLKTLASDPNNPVPPTA